MDLLNQLITTTDRLYLLDKTAFENLFSKQRIESVGGEKKYQDYYKITKALYPEFFSTYHLLLMNCQDFTKSAVKEYYNLGGK